MFEIGWTEMLVIAVVMIVIVGPKELPAMLRTFGKTTAKLRVMAGDFRKQFDEALKEAELDDLKTLADDARKLNPASEIKKALSPMEKAAQDVRAGLDAAMKPNKPATPPPASPEARAVEPAKTGATAMPGDGAAVAAETVEPVKIGARPAAPKSAPPRPAEASAPAPAAPAAARPKAPPKAKATASAKSSAKVAAEPKPPVKNANGGAAS